MTDITEAEGGDEAQNADGFTSIRIDGNLYQVRAPYKDGFVLTGVHTAALNRFFAENVANAARAKIVASKKPAKDGTVAEPPTPAEIQAFVTEFAANYEFGRSHTRIPVTDPVERILFVIVRDRIVKTKIKAMGVNLTEVSTERLHTLTEGLLNSTVPSTVAQINTLRELARHQYAQEQAAASLQLDIDFSLPQ